MMNWIERASALLRWKFCMICGEKTTTGEELAGALSQPPRYNDDVTDPNRL